jgi:hypothetical protein
MRILLFIFLFHTAIIAQENKKYLETVYFDMEFSAKISTQPLAATVITERTNNEPISHILISIEFRIKPIDFTQNDHSTYYIPKYLTSYFILEDNFNLIQPKLQMNLNGLAETAEEGRKSSIISGWLKPFHNIDTFKNTSVLGSGFGPIITL